MTELSRSAGLLVVLLVGCASNKHAIYNSEYTDRVSEAEARLNERGRADPTNLH